MGTHDSSSQGEPPRTLADAERELRAARRELARFETLGAAGVLGMVVSTAPRTVLDINTTLARMLGYTRDEILAPGFAWAERTPPEWAEVDARAMADLRETGIAGLREKEYLRKDGSRVCVMAGSAVVPGSDGEIVSFVIDVTDRKRAEAEAQRMREESVVAARIAAIVEASDDAILGVTTESVVTSWNRGARQIFGYEADEVIGKNIAMIIPPDRRHEGVEIVARMWRGEVTHIETVRRRKDGRDLDVAMTISPVFDDAGAVIGTSAVIRDVTERRRAEQALSRARDDAEASSRELEAFSYSVAHDLRAPLRGINGFAQILLDDYSAILDAEGRDCLEEIRSGAAKMGHLIDGLLSLSRVTRSELHRERVDLAALARASAAELAAADPGRRVEILTPARLDVAVDPRLARALVDNLVGNAWKFTRHAAAARIELGVRPEDGALFIRDNGAGFDMAHASKLFAPFQRMHTVHEFPGTGIGLATVQRIVLRHGGRIWAEARVGEGATFYFHVPADSAEGAP